MNSGNVYCPPESVVILVDRRLTVMSKRGMGAKMLYTADYPTTRPLRVVLEDANGRTIRLDWTEAGWRCDKYTLRTSVYPIERLIDGVL